MITIRLAYWKEALSLYRGDYLADDDFSWALSEREMLREQFTTIAKSLISYYMGKKDYIAAQKVILRLIDNNNLDEAAHEMLLRLYILKNDRAAFLKHYEKAKKLFQQELGGDVNANRSEIFTIKFTFKNSIIKKQSSKAADLQKEIISKREKRFVYGIPEKYFFLGSESNDSGRIWNAAGSG